MGKAYALSRQLSGQKNYFAKQKNGGGDSEHSDSSPTSTPPPIDKGVDVFSYADFEDYQQCTDVYESITNLRIGLMIEMLFSLSHFYLISSKNNH